MANLQRPNSTDVYIPAPTLFRSVFAGRPIQGYPKDPDTAVQTANKKEDEEDNHLDDDAVEGNKINTEDAGSEESDEDDKSNESRIKKSASDSDESGSDESDESDESNESDEEDDDDDDDKPKRKPSRWRQTRYGSSFRIQAVGRPINYRHDSRKPETPRY
ncbi:hypothetical protein DAPPUDRAFT_110517 [Daphnia pulex]|uniref:Uncharacterized protein n=1 Tax=Daphnia pulex TaxID=6669 RepID=E9H6H8_DAPPU|nr:hypothetical protein DAPPUDRAFT_110517 [Daphnia pulex]|eukprot:EFX72697.1 hypothetical protein DAPPUDRAFT_110517 [Daphnia pulex]